MIQNGKDSQKSEMAQKANQVLSAAYSQKSRATHKSNKSMACSSKRHSECPPVDDMYTSAYRATLRQYSPIPVDLNNYYETRLPNDNANYELSPAAKRAFEDGSLDPNAQFNRTFNRKLKMRDTFTKIFPAYNHGEETTIKGKTSITHNLHEYPKTDDLGRPTAAIDRTYTHKMDFIKEYTESMIKIQNMRR